MTSQYKQTHPANQARPQLTEVLEVEASNAGVQLASHEEIIQGIAWMEM